MNLVEKLRNFIEGTKMYSPLFKDPVTFVKINEGAPYPIICKTIIGEIFVLTKEGYYTKETAPQNCMLFPTPEMTWDGYEYIPEGSLVICKNDVAHQSLSEQLKEHSINRVYEAIVHGNLKQDEGTVNAPIGRHPTDRKKMSIHAKNGREAITHYKVLERFDGYSHVELTLETGRTHQIRVHMQSISCPVLADPLYAPNRKTFGLSGQCLHAKHIAFSHPITKEMLSFTAPLPEYFTNVLNVLRKRNQLHGNV